MSPGQSDSLEPQREACYRLLAACFYAPDVALWRAERVVESLCALLQQVCPAAVEPCRRMAEELSRSAEEGLRVEYTRLFLGPYHVVAPPWGSVYLDEGRRVMGDSTLATLDAYRRAGLSLDADFKELPDHVATELEFVSYLTARVAEAEAAGQGEAAAQALRAREEFVSRFLGRWVPAFCERIRQGTEHPFYRGLAGCLAALVAEPLPARPRISPTRRPEAGGAAPRGAPP